MIAIIVNLFKGKNAKDVMLNRSTTKIIISKHRIHINRKILTFEKNKHREK